MEQTQLLKAFEATVQASLHGLEALAPVVERERTALVGRDPAALEAVVQEKVALLEQLRHSVIARDRLLKSVGLAPGNDGGDRFVAGHGGHALGSDWARLRELAAALAQANDRNGQLVAQGQRTARAAIGILIGRNAADDTYSAAVTGRRRGIGGYSLGRV